jgi:hypothetical protein
MPAGITSTNAPWSRIVNSTIANFIREEQINILRNRLFTAMLKKRGRITYSWSGTLMDWKVRYRRAPMVGFADGDTVTFSRQDRDKTAKIDWRGFSAADQMTKGEFLQNRSNEAIIKLFDTRTTLLLQDVEDQFCETFYTDGSLAANSKMQHGNETFLSYANQAIGNGAMLPTATYAEINCALGAYGGSWSQQGNLQWPSGRGDASYDFWSPLVIDVGDTMWGTSAKWGTVGTTPGSCVEAVAFAIIKSKKSPSLQGELDCFILNDEAYRQYISQLRAMQRIVISGQISELIGMGFANTVQQDGGKDVTWEYGLPTSSQLGNGIGVIGYGFNFDQIELRSQQSQVWVPEGPSFDDATKSWRWSIDFFGNTCWNPKYQLKLLNFTTPTDSAQM